jgi:hypothetical protein
VEAPGLVAAALLVRVVLRVPADLLAGNLHVPEARVKVHLETANAAQVSPNTAIVLPDRVPLVRVARELVRAAKELARVARVMLRVGPANAVSANRTVNAVAVNPTVSVRVVHRVRVLVARVVVVRAARELVRAARVVVVRFAKSVSSGR